MADDKKDKDKDTKKKTPCTLKTCPNKHYNNFPKDTIQLNEMFQLMRKQLTNTNFMAPNLMNNDENKSQKKREIKKKPVSDKDNENQSMVRIEGGKIYFRQAPNKDAKPKKKFTCTKENCPYKKRHGKTNIKKEYATVSDSPPKPPPNPQSTRDLDTKSSYCDVKLRNRGGGFWKKICKGCSSEKP